ncbi:uncharacterized protein B0H18DRAFT_1028613, partial [Fomitopsis serialis]|uniref:uncharacterized protein n=1 Tax=Fomitopsis serialis TaxID=139415 RepID=UPI0020087609
MERLSTASGRVLKSLSVSPKAYPNPVSTYLAFELEKLALTIRLPQFFPIMPPQPQSLQSQFCETRSSLATHAEKIQTLDQAGCAASTGPADDHSDVLYVPAGQKREDGRARTVDCLNCSRTTLSDPTQPAPEYIPRYQRNALLQDLIGGARTRLRRAFGSIVVGHDVRRDGASATGTALARFWVSRSRDDFVFRMPENDRTPPVLEETLMSRRPNYVLQTTFRRPSPSPTSILDLSTSLHQDECALCVVCCRTRAFSPTPY